MRSYDLQMPLWRCPHCGTPQVESSRCWVCRRSTTSCAACRHFRRGVAGGLGVCGRDPRRLALLGTEMRACWDAAETTGTMGPPEDAPEDLVRIPMMAGAGSRPVRTFVPVESLSPMAAAPGRTAVAAAPGRTAVADATGDPYPGFEIMASGGAEILPRAMPARRIPGCWSLWGDLEP
jgi:hypothetical protein